MEWLRVRLTRNLTKLLSIIMFYGQFEAGITKTLGE